MRSFLLCLSLLVLAVPAAALMVEVPLDRLVSDADAIVRAQVVDLQSRWTDDRATIVTEVTLEVVDAWAGAHQAGDRLSLTVEGGEVGEMGIRSEHQPVFRRGEEAVLFLGHTTSARWRVLALEQGKFTVLGEEAVDFRGRPLPLVTLRAAVNSLRPGR